jgi:hypothetical protein
MFKININNEILFHDNTRDETISKQYITNEIAYKQPLFFHLSHMIKHRHLSRNDEIVQMDISNSLKDNDNASNDKKNNNSKNKHELDVKKEFYEYRPLYESIPLLEPFVLFDVTERVFEIKKRHRYLPVMRHLHYRNFYIVHQGSCHVHLVHPKYKDNFLDKNRNVLQTRQIQKYIQDSSTFIKQDLSEGDVLFVPNYWIVLVQSKDKNTTIELLQYKSMFNRLNFLCDKFLKF